MCLNIAINKAKAKYPKPVFYSAEVLDDRVIDDFEPDCICMVEVTWYILDKLEEQLDRISKQLRKDDDAVDKPKYEASKTKVLKTISDILQQKASIEITPTLDISLEKYINEKYGISKRTNHP